MERRREAQYHKKDFAPLGKSTAKADALPATFQSPEHVFGDVTKFSDTKIKDLVAPPEHVFALNPDDAKKVHRMYVKSHHAYHPGEQSHRNYQWSPAQQQAVWGTPSYQNANEEETVKESLVWKEEQQKQLQTKLTMKRVQDFRDKTQAQLGKSLDPFDHRHNLDPKHTFGVASKLDPMDAGKLIHPKAEQSVPVAPPPSRFVTINPITHLLASERGSTAAVKKSKTTSATKEGRPEEAAEHEHERELSARRLRIVHVPLGQGRRYPYLLPADHPNHIYGVPSIRTDIHRPAKPSLADVQNYGDEYDAGAVLNHELSRKLHLRDKQAEREVPF